MTAMLRACLAGLAFLLAGISAACAGDKTVILSPGNNSILVLNNSFETVIIGNRDVVDVHTQGDGSVILEPLKFGSSNIIFVDSRSIAIANVRVFVCNIIRTEYREAPDCE